MTDNLRPAGVPGARLLVLAGGEIDVRRYRKLGFTEFVIVHPRPDSSLDPRVAGPFDQAIVTGETSDPDWLRASVSYAVDRLSPGGSVVFVDPTGSAQESHAMVSATLTDMQVEVVSVRHPLTEVLEARPAIPNATHQGGVALTGTAPERANRRAPDLTLFIVTDGVPPSPERLRELADTEGFNRIAVSLIECSASHHVRDLPPWVDVMSIPSSELPLTPDAARDHGLKMTTTRFIRFTDASLVGNQSTERSIERGEILAERFGLLDAPFPLLTASGWTETEESIAYRRWIQAQHPDYFATHQVAIDNFLHVLPFRNLYANLHGIDIVGDGRTLQLTGSCRRGATGTVDPPDHQVHLVILDDNREVVVRVDTTPTQRMDGGRAWWTGFTANIPIHDLPIGNATIDMELGVPEGFEDVRVPVKTTVGMLAASRPVVAHGRRFQVFPVHGSERVELVTLKADRALARVRWSAKVLRRDFGAMVHRRPFAWTRVRRALTRPFYSRHPIWLIGERPDTARDNGFHFFTHVSRERSDIRAYYVIDRASDQFAQMSAIGRVIAHSSWRHRLLMLHAAALVNAYSIKHMVPRQWNSADYPRHFAWRVGSYRIYLKHGVHMNTKVVKRRVSGYDLFLTATPGETAGARETSGYDRQIAQTGLPRYDALIPTPHSRTILFMPTWRLYFLPKLFSEETEAAVPFDGSVYQQFIHQFLSSPRLHELLERHDYRLQFMPHYNMREHLSVAPNADGRIDILDGAAANIQDVMRGCDLFITDYSSVHFDLAYLGTPLIYSHFDHEDYHSGHALASWFEHERDGFGPVTHDLESTLDAMERYLVGGCVREEFYEQRAGSAFTFHDRNNSRRVVEAIEAVMAPNETE